MKVFDILTESSSDDQNQIRRELYKVQEIGSGAFKISVDATKGPALTPMLAIAYALKEKGAEIKSKSGLPIKFSTFKSNTVIAKNIDVNTINSIIDEKVQEHIGYHAERKERAKPENVAARNKEYRKSVQSTVKARADELNSKWGEDTVKRVKVKSMSHMGDDGYQWALFVDGRQVKNGLTKSQAASEQKAAWNWLKKVKEDPEQAQREIEAGKGIAAYFEYERMRKEIQHYLSDVSMRAKKAASADEIAKDAINKAKRK